MRITKMAVALPAFASAVVLLAACSGGVTISTSSPTPTSMPATIPAPFVSKFGPADPGVVVLTPKQLTEEVHTNPDGTVAKYKNKMLEIEGIVTEQDLPSGTLKARGSGDTVGAVVFKAQVTDKNSTWDYLIHCVLKAPIPSGNASMEDVKWGKLIKIRGRMGSNHTQQNIKIEECELVK